MSKTPKHIQVSTLNHRPLIFTTVHESSRSEKTIAFTINTLGWLVWLYLWKSVITTLAWFFGIRLIYQEWIVYRGWEGFPNFVEEIAPFGLVLCLSLWIWAAINIWRFRQEKRRTDIRYPSLLADSKWTALSELDLKNARSMQIIVCGHSHSGELTSVTPINPDRSSQSN